LSTQIVDKLGSLPRIESKLNKIYTEQEKKKELYNQFSEHSLISQELMEDEKPKKKGKRPRDLFEKISSKEESLE